MRDDNYKVPECEHVKAAKIVFGALHGERKRILERKLAPHGWLRMCEPCAAVYRKKISDELAEIYHKYSGNKPV